MRRRFIWVKPIIDILVAVSEECKLEGIKAVLVDNGYICMNQKKEGISFNKGYTEHGFAEKLFCNERKELGTYGK